MKSLKPFGDVPDKLSVILKRSFVATRTYAQALNIASDISKNVQNVSIIQHLNENVITYNAQTMLIIMF